MMTILSFPFIIGDNFETVARGGICSSKPRQILGGSGGPGEKNEKGRKSKKIRTSRPIMRPHAV
jgi:hypothetical protein